MFTIYDVSYTPIQHSIPSSHELKAMSSTTSASLCFEAPGIHSEVVLRRDDHFEWRVDLRGPFERRFEVFLSWSHL